MAGGYKVRLGDGSEIGPLDTDMVRTWFQQGLIGPETPCLKAGTNRWTRLGEAVDLKKWGGGGAATTSKRRGGGGGSAPSRGRGGPRVSDDPGGGVDIEIGRSQVAAGIFFLLAGAAGYSAFAPQHWLPELDDTPWAHVAAVLLVFGLALVRGWDLGRKFVRLACIVIAFAAFPLAGILVAQGVRGKALFVVLSLWVLFSGFFAFLSGASLPLLRFAASLLLVVGGAAGIGYFGWVGETEQDRAVREWASAERRFTDDQLGVAVDVPSPWIILRPGNTLVAVPPQAKVSLAHPRVGAFGFLAAETAPKGVASLEEYLTRWVAARRRSIPSLKELERGEAGVGSVSGRRVTSAWESEGVRFRDVTIVWKDGWTYFTLVGWVPEAAAARGTRDLDELAAAVSIKGTLAARLQQALQKVTLEVPYLSTPAAELLMSHSEAQVLEPEEAFRRGFAATSRGLPALSPAEMREVAALTSATYAALPKRERGRLAGYLERVRSQELTSPNEDREMCGLMKQALLRLPAERRLRMQTLYEKAIRAATAVS